MPFRTDNTVVHRQRRYSFPGHPVQNGRHDGAIQILKFQPFAKEEKLLYWLMILFEPINRSEIASRLAGWIVDALFPALVVDGLDGLLAIVRIDDNQRGQLHPLPFDTMGFISLFMDVAFIAVINTDLVIKHADMKTRIVKFSRGLTIDDHRFPTC